MRCIRERERERERERDRNTIIIINLIRMQVLSHEISRI